MTEKEILSALTEVVHPANGGKSVVELGMVDSVSVDFMPDCEENEGGLNADEPKRKDLEQLKRICKNY